MHPREELPEAEARMPQYRSVNWGDSDDYSSWREIDPLDQPAAYKKPFYVNKLIAPDNVSNSCENEPYSAYKEASIRRRSAGVDYNQKIFKQTPSDGFRRDTKFVEYKDQPQCEDYKPRTPYMLKREKKLRAAPTAGVVKIGEQAPLEYPEYERTTYEYQRMVPQNYQVTQTDIKLPEYIPYEAPRHEFLEYEVQKAPEVQPTYYEAGYRADDKTWGYIERPEPAYTDYPTEYYPEREYYREPTTKRRYPSALEQTYNTQKIAET